MKGYFILVGVIVLLLSLVVAYTPILNSDEGNFSLTSSYVLYNNSNELTFELYESFVNSSSCIYAGTGSNWNINCSENCSVSSNYNILKKNITISGSGIININANITNFSFLNVYGTDSVNKCIVNVRNGGNLYS